MKRKIAYPTTLLAIVAIWVVGLGCWPFLIWSPLNCSYDDVDINSGRVRHQRYLLGLCIHESIGETSLSRLVPDIGSKPAEWHRVTTFSPLVSYSPHHQYHAAIFQISMLDAMWRSAAFTPAAKRQMALDVLALWQTGVGYFPVNEYLNSIEPIWSKAMEHKKLIDINDLPIRKSVK